MDKFQIKIRNIKLNNYVSNHALSNQILVYHIKAQRPNSKSKIHLVQSKS